MKRLIKCHNTECGYIIKEATEDDMDILKDILSKLDAGPIYILCNKCMESKAKYLELQDIGSRYISIDSIEFKRR